MKTAVVYKVTLVRVPKSEPLKGCSYYGQAVRSGNPKKVAKARWREEVWESFSKQKEVGFLALLRRYGKDVFDWKIVDYFQGDEVEATDWANTNERRLIADNGGPLKSMLHCMRQTLNQNSGGKGNMARATDCYANIAFNKFKVELIAYVEEFKTAKVSKNYCSPNGYHLYTAVKNVRTGMLFEGRPDEDEIREWLSSLPGWSFQVHEEQWSQFLSHITAYVCEFEDADVPTKYVCDDGYGLGVAVSNVRSNNAFLTGKDADFRRETLESFPGWSWNSLNSDRARTAISRATTIRMQDEETKTKIVSALQKGRDEAVAKRRREYVDNAKQSALPYEPVKKKRTPGVFYFRPDGSIGRCTTQLCLKKVVD